MLTSFNKRSSWLAQSIEQIKTKFKCKYCNGNIRESYKKIEFRRDFDGKTLSNRKGKRVSKFEKVVTVNDKLDFTDESDSSKKLKNLLLYFIDHNVKTLVKIVSLIVKLKQLTQ